ncbi:hypothetical protein LOZ66_006136 [Ophidiomyces ophidiicola]|nr:hypothetical protein LOZ65_002147 [Ophidiomyces ophidiicola]KAI1934043.1 hypothetical protein LOZ66_006136 [Ophidiomyces ophidiicola]
MARSTEIEGKGVENNGSKEADGFNPSFEPPKSRSSTAPTKDAKNTHGRLLRPRPIHPKEFPRIVDVWPERYQEKLSAEYESGRLTTTRYISVAYKHQKGLVVLFFGDVVDVSFLFSRAI